MYSCTEPCNINLLYIIKHQEYCKLWNNSSLSFYCPLKGGEKIGDPIAHHYQNSTPLYNIQHSQNKQEQCKAVSIRLHIDDSSWNKAGCSTCNSIDYTYYHNSLKLPWQIFQQLQAILALRILEVYCQQLQSSCQSQFQDFAVLSFAGRLWSQPFSEIGFCLSSA